MEYIKTHAWQFGIYLLAFIAPIKGILILLGFLLLSDLLTGIWKSYRRGQKITSHKMSHTITKMVLYSMAIILTHGIEMVFPTLALLNMTNIAGGYVCLVELKSIYENVSALTGLDIWKHLIERAKGLKKLTDDITGDNTPGSGGGEGQPKG